MNLEPSCVHLCVSMYIDMRFFLESSFREEHYTTMRHQNKFSRPYILFKNVKKPRRVRKNHGINVLLLHEFKLGKIMCLISFENGLCVGRNGFLLCPDL